MNKLLILLCFMVAIVSCKSVEYLPPSDGKMANVSINVPGNSLTSNTIVSIGVADENGCAETLNKLSGEYVEQNNIAVPAGKKVIFNVLNIIGPSRCHITRGVEFEPSKNYEVEIVRNGGCLGVFSEKGSSTQLDVKPIKPYKFGGACIQ